MPCAWREGLQERKTLRSGTEFSDSVSAKARYGPVSCVLHECEVIEKWHCGDTGKVRVPYDPGTHDQLLA
jgi:hypothetical protein